MAIGTTAVCHIALVVKDIYKTVDNWAKFLGVEKPEISVIPGKDVAPGITNGKLEDYHGCLIAVFHLDNIILELAQPGEEPNPWSLAIERHGEGVQHISFIVPDRVQAEDTLRELGVEGHYHIGYYPDSTYAFFDSKEALGVEVNIKTENDDNVPIIKRILGEAD